MNYKWHRIFIVSLLCFGMALLILFMWPIVMAAEQVRVLPVVEVQKTAPHDSVSLRLMSANLAHGRSDGIHQLRQDAGQIELHLQDINKLFSQYAPDVVALQEADAPSWWSGSMNHVDLISDSFAHYAHALHVDGFGLHYGTGILSKSTITHAWAHTFAPTPPTMSKGFCLVEFPLQHKVLEKIYLISLHTDFASSAARIQQLNYLKNVILLLDAPCVIMGDFNCSYLAEGSPLPAFLQQLNMKTYRPLDQSESLQTFRFNQSRIDWICIPNTWSFQSFQVLPDIVSDHSIILADVTISTH